MMKKFQELLKGKSGKKALNFAVILFVAGLAIFVVYGFFQNSMGAGSGLSATDPPAATAPPVADTDAYVTALEQKLEDTLSQIDGAGKVTVMLTLASGGDITVAQDSTTNSSTTTQTDSAGGTSTSKTDSADSKNVITSDKNGNDSPLILNQSQPKVEGVIVMAEGGGDASIRYALTNAVAAVLGVDAYKIQVFKMK